jgi:hypothetical protein
MKYQAKVDLWVRLLLYVILLMFFTLIFFVPEEEIIVIVIVTLSLALIIIPLFFTYYEMREDFLFIRISVFTKKISYDKIKSLKLCENWKSRSPMTRERIEIKEHDKGLIRGTTYIGPKARNDMYYKLVERCRNLTKETN